MGGFDSDWDITVKGRETILGVPEKPTHLRLSNLTYPGAAGGPDPSFTAILDGHPAIGILTCWEEGPCDIAFHRIVPAAPGLSSYPDAFYVEFYWGKIAQDDAATDLLKFNRTNEMSGQWLKTFPTTLLPVDVEVDEGGGLVLERVKYEIVEGHQIIGTWSAVAVETSPR